MPFGPLDHRSTHGFNPTPFAVLYRSTVNPEQQSARFLFQCRWLNLLSSMETIVRPSFFAFFLIRPTFPGFIAA
jgi:hypothetical protein